MTKLRGVVFVYQIACGGLAFFSSAHGRDPSVWIASALLMSIIYLCGGKE
jgi:hypothetical protein